jgi:hypothetical protein
MNNKQKDWKRKEDRKLNLRAEESFVTEIPHTIGFPITPSNLINKPSSPSTKALRSDTTRGLFAPTCAYMSRHETTYKNNQ